MARSTPPLDATDGDACYLAMKTHDARFDGAFFTAVTSTGIYCRPVCRVKLPRRENCRFYRHAAQAEAAGFRPCLRCRPELAPRAGAAGWSTEDASRTLALQAARLMDEPEVWSVQAPTLPASRGSLPPEGAFAALGRPGGGDMAPTLPASRGSLPPEGAFAALGRPGGGDMAPTLPASQGSLSPEGASACLRWPGASLMRSPM